VNSIDPALRLVAFDPEIQLLAPTCATLMAYPETSLPGGYRLAPSLAETEPVVSRDGRTYTFTVRKDARFSTGAPVTARAFSHALERILDPAMQSDGSLFADIVGAADVMAGKATTPRGVFAKGRTLILRLTKHASDLRQRLTELCAVPPDLPSDPEGAKAPVPSPAPYYVSEYVPGQRVVLQRNRFYHGERPHHVDRFVADLTADEGTALDQVLDGAVDTALPTGLANAHSAELAKRFGVNRTQFFVAPGSTIRLFYFNTSRPLFKNNVQLRQAVNFAVDRKALAREDGFLVDTPIDQYLVPGTPGYRNARIYPLAGPDLGRARALAKGHTRGGKAALYTLDLPVDVAQAQILQQNLRKIGLKLEIKPFPPPPSILFGKLSTSGEPWELGRVRQGGFPDDPSILDCFKGSQCNFSHFDSPRFNRLLERASRLTGEARSRAYGELDVEISRDAAPAIPVAIQNDLSFVSARVGCVVVNPELDLTAVCLK